MTISTAPRAPVFADLAFGGECAHLLGAVAAPYSADLYAYCLMPDHAHLLLALGRGSLTDLVGEWKSQCYRARRHRGYASSFWQRSFWDHALRDDEEELLAVALYILANPVRAGLVADWRDYPLCGSAVWEL